MSTAALESPLFQAALADLGSVRVRPEITLEQTPAPARIAPYSYALEAEVDGAQGESGHGRFILLHDPDGFSAWDGTFRVVIFVAAEIDPEWAADTMLAEVAWSWVTDGLEAAQAGFTALGGTVTMNSSTRFGDIAGPERTDDVEIRASWTMTDGSADVHLRAYLGLLAGVVGLPPEGVSAIRVANPPVARGL